MQKKSGIRIPQAREIVMLAVMSALCVVSRAAFIWAPQFKPMTAMIIITAVAFGPQAGFVTGMLSAFVSNFIFGQGPWTIWQMAAYGIAGLLAGAFHRKGFLKDRPVSLAVFGAILVVIIVGPILDTCAIFTMPGFVATWKGVLAIYMSGLPVNMVHAVATVLTLLILSKPLLEKLERIKVKYGIMED